MDIKHNKYNCFLLACVIVKRQTHTVDLFNVMCDNVTAITFDRATVPDDPSAIRSVRISMTVSADDLSQTLVAAAVVRRNL